MTVDEIARLVGGKVRGDGRAQLDGIAQLETASDRDLAYADGSRAAATAKRSRAGCILVADSSPFPGRATIEVKNPKLAFIQAAEALVPSTSYPAGIHATAVISAAARLGERVFAGPHSVVARGAVVEEGVVLMTGVSIGEGARVGEGSILHPGVVLYPGSSVGKRAILHAGVVVGGDGFGYVLADGRYNKFPQIGGIVIEDDVEIGCNTTIDRGSLGTTRVGEGTKIDNLVQIAHNVSIGRHCVIAAQTGISGSVEIGDEVVIGGQVGIGDHVRIESHVVVGSGAGILTGKIVREGSVVWGTPARPLADAKRIYAMMAHLPKITRSLKVASRKARRNKPPA